MPYAPKSVSHFEPGDILAFYGRDWRSRVIEFITFGPSHVGIVCDLQIDDIGCEKPVYERVLVESTTMCKHPCLLRRCRIDGVQVQWPLNRIRDYQGRVKLFRLAKDRSLTRGQQRSLRNSLRSYVGLAYNLTGALWSGTRFLKHLPFFGYTDSGTMFCSQMIAKVLMPFNLLPLGSSGVYNPGSLIRTLLRCESYQRGVWL